MLLSLRNIPKEVVADNDRNKIKWVRDTFKYSRNRNIGQRDEWENE